MGCGFILWKLRDSFAKGQGRLRSGLVLVDRIRWILIRRREVGRGGSGVGSGLSWRDGSAADRDRTHRADRRLGSTLARAFGGARSPAVALDRSIAGVGVPGAPSTIWLGDWTWSERVSPRTQLGTRERPRRPEQSLRRQPAAAELRRACSREREQKGGEGKGRRRASP